MAINVETEQAVEILSGNEAIARGAWEAGVKLAAAYPGYIAAAWCGHNEKVAEEHYWQITEADWQRAASQPTGELLANSGQKAGQKLPQNTPKTQNAVDPGHGQKPQESPRNQGKTAIPLVSIPLCQLPGEDSNLE